MNSTSPRRLIRSLTAAACVVAGTAEWQPAVAATRTVALSGQQAPGAATGVVFSDFAMAQYEGPALNNLGLTAFMATLAHGSVDATNDRGIWSEGAGAGALGLEAREGDQALGAAAGAVFRFFNQPQFNDANQLLFEGYLAEGPGGITTANDNGLWYGNSGSVSAVARKGEPTPDAPPGATFTGFSPDATLNQAGQLSFQAGATTTTATVGGIWLGGGGTLNLVVRSGDPAPGAPGMEFYGINPPSLSDSGKFAFFADMRDSSGSPPGLFLPLGMWSGEAGSISPILIRGDQAPGLPAGALIDGFNSGPLVNAVGNILVYAYLKPGGGSTVLTADSGVMYIQRGGSMDLVLRSDSHAPGTPTGTRFAHFGFPVFNAEDEVAFRGSLREGFGDVGMNTENGEGIWAGDPGSLRLVARAGSHAPGTPTGAAFWAFAPTGPVLNDAGQTAFEGELKIGVGGVTADNDLGIWAEDRTGALRLIVREGNKLDVDDGPAVDRRTVSGLQFLSLSGAGDGRSSGFNDVGQLAFRAIFTDGSVGIFVSDLAAIPEPASAAPALAAAFSVLGLRRRF